MEEAWHGAEGPECVGPAQRWLETGVSLSRAETVWLPLSLSALVKDLVNPSHHSPDSDT